MKESLSLNEIREKSRDEIEKIFMEGVSKGYRELILDDPDFDLNLLIQEYIEVIENSPIEDDEQSVDFDDFISLKKELLLLKSDLPDHY